MLYKQLIRPILFQLRHGDAEHAHERTLALLATFSRLTPLVRLARRLWPINDPRLARTLFGVRFPNPIGLAAGMDKDGVALPAWAALGFGFVEVGTVTWYAQPGNPRPRLFRIPSHETLINRMGFNNSGASALAGRLHDLLWQPIPLGISLGKSRITDIEHAVQDYRASFRTLVDYASYIAVNVSSPNTPGLRALQDRAHLSALLDGLQEENQLQRHTCPLLVKIAPDLSEPAIAELLEVCADNRVSGVIATNTTLSREGLGGASPRLVSEAGGLSGRPLAERARQVVRFISRETKGRLPIIGVGGIAGPDDALRMLDAGADLIQIYTGLVYEGPGLIRRINRAISRRG